MAGRTEKIIFEYGPWAALIFVFAVLGLYFLICFACGLDCP